jgi:hypothetical protein
LRGPEEAPSYQPPPHRSTAKGGPAGPMAPHSGPD